MNAYACTECGWQYDWSMGDRVKAVKRHQLAHLVERHRRRNDTRAAVNTLLTAGEQPGDPGTSRAFKLPRGHAP